MNKQVWYEKFGYLFLQNKAKKPAAKLDNKVYELIKLDPLGFCLKPISDDFAFPYKIYGLETTLINRVLKYYNNTTAGNLGVLLNGLKGTGKTVTAKILSNKLDQPVVIISTGYDGAEDYINSIPQNLTIFVDEYEKIYEKSSEFLTIMDGAMNSIYRRVFLLTTNTLNIDSNLLDRPSRIRYTQTFSNLYPEVVEEIVDDMLLYPEFKEDCIQYISTIEIITVDIVKAIINEINIHNESPNKFKNIFNVSVKKGKYVVEMYGKDGQITQVAKGVKFFPHPDFNENCIGRNPSIDGQYFGEIVDVLGYNTIKVKLLAFKEEGDEDGYENHHDLPDDEGEYVFTIRPDYVYNDSYKFNREYGTGNFLPDWGVGSIVQGL